MLCSSLCPGRMTPDDEAATYEATWDDQCPEKWRSRKPNVIFTYCHQTIATQAQATKPERPDQAWVAKCKVHSRNIPRLMRHGFTWTHANVRKEQCFFQRGLQEKQIPPSQRGYGWENMSVFVLEDLDGGSDWAAEITVYSTCFTVLVDFDLDLVNGDNLFWAEAYNWKGGQVYSYDKLNPEHNLNVIYGDMPMQGEWPWPKENDGDTTDLDTDFGPSVCLSDSPCDLGTEEASETEPHKEPAREMIGRSDTESNTESARESDTKTDEESER